MNPIKMVKSAISLGENTAQTVKHAGMGAYKLGLEQAGMAQHMMTKRMNSLVEKGADVESETIERVKQTQAMLQERTEGQFNKVMKMSCGVDRERLSKFESKIDSLQEAVDALLAKEK